jgi:hypothetical protein
LFDNYAITAEGTTEKFVLGVEGTTTADFKFDLEKAYMDIPVDSNQDFKVSALLQVKYQSIDGTTVTSYSDSSFSMMDLKAIQADVTPTEDSQNSKYSQSIKIFGHYEPKNNGANEKMIFSLSMFVLLALFFVFN